MLRLAFVPSTIFFENLPVDLYLVHLFGLLYSVLPYKCTIFYNVAIFLLNTHSLQFFIITNNAAMNTLDMGSCSREYFSEGTYQEVDRLCHCFCKRASQPLTPGKLLEGCIGLFIPVSPEPSTEPSS